MAVDPLHIDRSDIPTANQNISGRLRHRNATASSSRMTNHTTNSVATSNAHADDSDDDGSDPEDNKPLGQMVTKSPQRERNAAARPVPPTATRVSRTQKRPHYNEDSDESINDQYNSHHIRGGHPSKKRHVDDTSSEDDGEPEISVSSRGRVRKISSKVRGYFRE